MHLDHDHSSAPARSSNSSLTNESKIAWFHCFSGVAGNMAMGSLIDAGANVDDISEIVNSLDIAPFVIEATPVLRAGIAATYVNVKIEDDVVSRDYQTIVALIESAELPIRVKQRSLSTFRVLAEAEAAIHGTNIDEIHFHEVGSMDAIVDIVGTAAALELLNVDQVYCSSITNGMGTIHAAHGAIPNPAPAVTRILEGVPTIGRDIDRELTTPTGAALMKALAHSFGAMPAMTIASSGFGAGTKELPNNANATQVVIGVATSDKASEHGQPITIVEVTVDDISGELLAYTLQQCLDVGAHDAWLTPILMKKGRPGFIVSAICDAAKSEQIREVLRSETGSFGIRATHWSRFPMAREFTTVVVREHEITIKVSDHRAKVEFDDAVKAATALGMPVREIIREAEQAYWASQTD